MKRPDLHFIVDKDFNLFDLSHPVRSEIIKPLIFIHSSYRKSTPTQAWDYFDHAYFNADHSENRHKVVFVEGQEGIMQTTYYNVCEVESNEIKINLGYGDSWGNVGQTSTCSVMISADVWDKSGVKKRLRFNQFYHSNRASFMEVFAYLRELKKVDSHTEALKNVEFKHLRD
jgi:hypothetical protein